jgi:dethiobiotin synthetase/adenosylmethionine--8-amino-7-oxononanoate aminotransferase
VSSRNEKIPRSDKEILEALNARLAEISTPSSCFYDSTKQQQQQQQPNITTTWIETAGGVLSPSSSSPDNNSPRHASSASDKWGWLTQGDLYQPLIGIAPVVLCGDGRLGGINATLTSLESLILRGYDVAGIIMLETGYDNVYAIREYASR